MTIFTIFEDELSPIFLYYVITLTVNVDVKVHQLTDLGGFLQLGIHYLFQLTCLLIFSNNTSNMHKPLLFGQWQTESEEWNKKENVN